jgi:hypothetical protein
MLAHHEFKLLLTLRIVQVSDIDASVLSIREVLEDGLIMRRHLVTWQQVVEIHVEVVLSNTLVLWCVWMDDTWFIYGVTFFIC